MLLELRNVSSLTEARFAAGEGFTHIRFDPDFLLQATPDQLQAIAGFVSGLELGANLDSENASQVLPLLSYSATKTDIKLHSSESAQPYYDLTHLSEAEVERLLSATPEPVFSLKSPGEERPGMADFSNLQILLERIEEYR
jgi:hypothetical protein